MKKGGADFESFEVRGTLTRPTGINNSPGRYLN
jgi:hypothetical protein